jgi:hypothetical protein
VTRPRLEYRCRCGHRFPLALGKYGCPNCNGDKMARPRWGNQCDSGQNKLGPSDDRWKERSRTFAGIAEAMAAQWGGTPNAQVTGAAPTNGERSDDL